MSGAAGLDVGRLARASRRGAILSLLGFILIALAIGYSIVEINRLTARKDSLEHEITDRTQELQELHRQIASAQAERQRLADQSAMLTTELTQKQQLLDRVSHQLGTGQVDLATRALEDTAATVPAAEATPLVYFQIRSRDQSSLYQSCATALKAHGTRVPKPELVSKGPGVTQVRFFRASDSEEANKIKDLLKQCVSSPIEARAVAGYANSPLVRPNQFEVWFAPDAT